MIYSQAIDTVCDFLETKVARNILLKKAADDGQTDADGRLTPAKLVHPTVSPVYTPEDAPALVVTTQNAETDSDGVTRQLMRIMCAVWDDGLIIPDGEGELEQPPDFTTAYRACANLCEIVLRAAREYPALPGLYLTGPFKMGFYGERDGYPDYWPYSIGYVEFMAEYTRPAALDPYIARMIE